VELEAQVHNRSCQYWPAYGRYPVRVSYHWLTADRDLYRFEGLRTELPQTVVPSHASVSLWLRVEAPEAPGDYILEILPVQEGCCWLVDKGFTVAEIAIRAL
jgi:hypothetical protein